MENIFLVLNFVTVCLLLFAIIFTAGVVWRVEAELDISYKFFLAAILFIFAAQIVDLASPWISGISSALVVKILYLLFAGTFLAGVLLMRDIVRKMDGEKDEK